MTELEMKQQDSEVAQSALAALKAAQENALKSGEPVAYVVERKLILSTPFGQRILKILKPRLRVSNRVKRASS